MRAALTGVVLTHPNAPPNPPVPFLVCISRCAATRSCWVSSAPRRWRRSWSTTPRTRSRSTARPRRRSTALPTTSSRAAIECTADGAGETRGCGGGIGKGVDYLHEACAGDRHMNARVLSESRGTAALCGGVRCECIVATASWMDAVRQPKRQARRCARE
eukprot:4595279-Prymnesium_polylepis.1